LRKGNEIAAAHKRKVKEVEAETTHGSGKRIQLGRNSYSTCNQDNPLTRGNPYLRPFEAPSSYPMPYGSMYHHTSQPPGAPGGYVHMPMPYYAPTQPYMYPNMNSYPYASICGPPIMSPYMPDAPQQVWLPTDSNMYNSTPSYMPNVPAPSPTHKSEINHQCSADSKAS
jgi:hypothetical protein